MNRRSFISRLALVAVAASVNVEILFAPEKVKGLTQHNEFTRRLSKIITETKPTNFPLDVFLEGMIANQKKTNHLLTQIDFKMRPKDVTVIK